MHHVDRNSPPRRLAGKALLVAFLAVGAIGGPLAKGAAAEDPAPPLSPGGTSVSYRGWTATVPAHWPVIDLEAAPSTCVRFDQHAVYLGRPAAEQDCPATARGRTEAILVEPVDGAASTSARPADVETAEPAFREPFPPSATAEQQLRQSVPSAGVMVTATWGDDPSTVRQVLGSATPSPGWSPPSTPPARSEPSTRSGGMRVAGLDGFVGKAFDNCSAPSLAFLDAWKASPYEGVSAYIGGVNRACSQPNLSASWVRTALDSGWRLIPVYVGLQAPVDICGCASIDPARAASQGRAAADDAVAKAQAVAIGPGSTIFFDMEAYTRGSRNTPPVLTYLSSWTERLHELGYRSAVYSSSSSGILDLVEAGPEMVQPDVVWYANWDGRPVTTGDPWLPDSMWRHERVHQYANVVESWGGYRDEIDRNAVDVSGAGAEPPAPPPSPPPPPPSPPPPPPSVAPELVQDYITRVFDAVLGRQPNQAERDLWAWCLVTGTPPETLVGGLLTSPDWASATVSGTYRTVMHRPADPGGAEFWSEWLSEVRRPNFLAAHLAASPEYWARSGSSEVGFVTNLYRDLLGREPDPGGLSWWTEHIRTTGSSAHVASWFAHSPERHRSFVSSAYQQLLRRAADAPGLDYWSGVYAASGDPASVLVPLAASREAVTLR